MAVLEGISIILVIATVAAYVPQWLRLHSLQTSSGISLFATCLLTLVAQGQVLSLLFVWLNTADKAMWLIRLPDPTLQDTVNLTQILMQWLCSVVTFVLVCMHYPLLEAEDDVELADAEDDIHELGAIHDRSVYVAIALVVGHALLGLVGLAFDSSARDHWPQSYAVPLTDQLVFVRIWSCLAVLAMLAQIAHTWMTTAGHNSLSTVAMLFQSTTYAFLAAIWPNRFSIPEKLLPGYQGLERLWELWYPRMGYAAVNNGALAIGSVAVLAIILSRQPRDSIAL